MINVGMPIAIINHIQQPPVMGIYIVQDAQRDHTTLVVATSESTLGPFVSMVCRLDL